MQIKQVDIRRFRVFDQRSTVRFRKLTVLTGPNNLGKSTVLSALDLFFSVFHTERRYVPTARKTYRHEVDYPKKYEGKAGRRWPTQIKVTFDLTEEDCFSMFESLDVHGSINEVQVTIEFHWNDRLQRHMPSLDIGLDSDVLAQAFMEWVGREVRYVYIPAARNVQDFRRGPFSELIAGALAKVSRSKQRFEALQRLHEDIKAEVATVEADVIVELQKYLPDVRGLKFPISELDIDRLVSVQDVIIDDGADTTLQQKGDGFKSLFSISLLQYLAKQRYGKNLIFAIEEPEAHLHSSAIYEIKNTLRGLAESFQVLITTHSPILLQRDDLEANVIVERGANEEWSTSTRSAQSLGELRRSLGIRAHENMTTAEVVVVAEGLTEERVLPVLLSLEDDEVKSGLAAGRVRILGAGGAGNIPATVRALARDATACIVLVDADQEGRNAAERVRASGFIAATDVLSIPARDGCPETEFEDLFDPNLYLQSLSDEVGLIITIEEFTTLRAQSGSRGIRCAKWSVVMERAATERGMFWSDIMGSVKAAAANGINSSARRGVGDEQMFVRTLRSRIRSYLRQPT